MRTSQNHRRRLSAVLSGLDETLALFERMAGGKTYRGPMFREEQSLSPGQRRAVLREVAAIRQVLVEVKAELGLDERAEHTARQVWAQCSVLWESLCELQPRHLRQYSAVPRRLAEYLTPRVDDLIAAVVRIQRIACPKEAPESPDDDGPAPEGAEGDPAARA